MVEQACARDLLLYLDSALRASASGKRAKPVHLRRILDIPPLGKYEPDTVYTAASYLAQRGFAALVLENPGLAPKRYVFSHLTAKGYDYLTVIRDDSLWKKLSRRIGNVFEASIPELVSVAAEFGVKRILG